MVLLLSKVGVRNERRESRLRSDSQYLQNEWKRKGRWLVVKEIDREANKRKDGKYMQTFAWWAMKRECVARCAYGAARRGLVSNRCGRRVMACLSVEAKAPRRSGLGTSLPDLSKGSIRPRTRGKLHSRIGKSKC